MSRAEKILESNDANGQYDLLTFLKMSGAKVEGRDIRYVTAALAEQLAARDALDMGNPRDLAFIKKYAKYFGLTGNIWNDKFIFDTIEELPGSNPDKKAVKAFVEHAMGQAPHADELSVYPCRMWWD